MIEYEELVFRGFLWARLVIAYGRTRGTIISGLFFGMMHTPLDIVFNNKTIFQVFVLGNTTNSNILGGVVGALVFIYIFKK